MRSIDSIILIATLAFAKLWHILVAFGIIQKPGR
jgi:hypothetical protein